eukprot:1141812-Pelagomonas_calceolata.AAC.4
MDHCLGSVSLSGCTQSVGTTKEGVMRGAYIVREADSHPDVLLIATGSELQLAYDAAVVSRRRNCEHNLRLQNLTRLGVQAQVVSMVCWELFEEQDQEYKNRVLPPDVDARVSVEASVPFGWTQFLGAKGRHVGIPQNQFGTSGPTAQVYQHFGITIDNVVKAAMEQMPTLPWSRCPTGALLGKPKAICFNDDAAPIHGKLPGLDEDLYTFAPGGKGLATRQRKTMTSKQCI